MKQLLCVLCASAVLMGMASAAEPVLRIVKSSATAANLVQNGDFERAQNGLAANWSRYEGGYELESKAGRNGSAGIVCQNDQTSGGRGASQSVALNQREPVPIIIKGWSKAEGVSGSADNNYSIYVDLVYADDTTLWGQTANFRCGTHDWEAREVVITPEKPVKRLSVYCLFRGHSGKVWFDDVRMEQLQAGEKASLFQGAFIELPTRAPAPIGNARIFATKDGLSLTMAGDRVVDGSWPRSLAPGGFMARDVAKNSDFFDFASGDCPDLGLKIAYKVITQANHIAIEGRVLDTTGADRAIILVFAMPVMDGDVLRDDAGFGFGHRLRGSQSYGNEVSVKCGATGNMSLYPIMPMWRPGPGTKSLAIGLDMAYPALYRVGFSKNPQLLYIAYDFGLCRDTARFPGAADFRFVMFNFDGQWGFRGAWKKYMQIFPDYFQVRSKEQGIWMPFTDISTVQGWQDFGFKYKEGNNNVKFDDANNILTFRYTEPMTWWMPMAKELARTPETALKVRDELLATGKPGQKTPAQVTKVAAMHDESGQPALLFRNEPWCNGAVWSLNPNPHLPGDVNFAQWHWSEETKKKLYGPEAKGQLDGEYLDSLEGYVTADLNFRRDHFTQTTVPLAFTQDTKKPCLYKGLAVFEFTKWFCDDVHRLNKLTFANGVPYRFTFLCPWLDVMGTETDWNRGGKWQPPSDATLSLWRFMSGGKPYVLLMNTHYDAFTPDLVEKYFQRCAFYGFYPSMFSHNASENPYWGNPKWYNRDRPLFKKYLPVIKRVAEAGWQPVPLAVADNSNLWLERFGEPTKRNLYLTVFNSTTQVQRGKITLPSEISKSTTAMELLSQGRIPIQDGRWEVELKPEQVAVFSF